MIINKEKRKESKMKTDNKKGADISINWFSVIVAIIFLLLAIFETNQLECMIDIGLSMFNMMFVIGDFTLQVARIAKDNNEFLEEIKNKLDGRCSETD